MVDDGTLLREYAESGSESAFAEVVRRHMDLVYSTALRGVNGDQSLAQDVCQAVFIDLVRKARTLSKSESVGWLALHQRMLYRCKGGAVRAPPPRA